MNSRGEEYIQYRKILELLICNFCDKDIRFDNCDCTNYENI